MSRSAGLKLRWRICLRIFGIVIALIAVLAFLHSFLNLGEDPRRHQIGQLDMLIRTEYFPTHQNCYPKRLSDIKQLATYLRASNYFDRAMAEIDLTAPGACYDNDGSEIIVLREKQPDKSGFRWVHTLGGAIFRKNALQLVVDSKAGSIQSDSPVPSRPEKWSWDLVRNGRVYSYTQHEWVQYPSSLLGDGEALKERLDNFHQIHGLPPVGWIDEFHEVAVTNGLYGCTITDSGEFSVPDVGFSLVISPGWKMTAVLSGHFYRINSAKGEIALNFMGTKTPEEGLQMIITAGDRRFVSSEPFTTKSGLKGLKGCFGSTTNSDSADKYFLLNSKSQVVSISVSSCKTKRDQDMVEAAVLQTLQRITKPWVLPPTLWQSTDPPRAVH